jgi:predicted RND superfamily exporter protein
MSVVSPAVSKDERTSSNEFDPRSGSAVERALFNHRQWILIVCALLTVLFAWSASDLRVNANFEKIIPKSHPYIANFLAHRQELGGLGNAVRIAVATTGESIYDPHYLKVLQQLSDEAFLLPGVDRRNMKSLWTPNTRWVGVTEDGMDGGPVIQDGYDGSPKSLATLRLNVERSNEIGQLVALDQRSSIVYLPLLSKNANGVPLDYADVSDALERLRVKYQSGGVSIHITGFAKVMGDLIAGIWQILGFFAAAVFITTAMLYAYTRCVRSAVLVVACSLVAVLWQLGLMPLLGYELDPYSVLVPFLVFAIGMSHGAQKMNGIMQDIGRGANSLVAARYTFRRLFLAGLTALLCDAVGFGVLMVIDIEAIRDLAFIASLGVAVLVFTNLILLPILLSYVSVSPVAAQRSLKEELTNRQGGVRHPLWRLLDLFTQRRWAAGAVAVSLLLGTGGLVVAQRLKVGDLQPGAPELRDDSRYNRDNTFMTAHYGASSDAFIVMIKTPEGQCSGEDTLMRIDALEWRIRALPGVDDTNSLALLSRRVLVGLNEGSSKWYEVIKSQSMLNTITAGAPRGLYNDTCSLSTLAAYLKDHKADTLTSLVDEVADFARENNTEQVQFLLAAGNSGIDAATNIVVREANREMLFWVYGAVILLCAITFRSWRAVLCAVLPLILTSVLCEALMVALNIGVKVATLPVIALGVGIGVDYALYVMSILLARLKAGDSLSQAYYQSLLFTGKVVLLTGVTLALCVATWVLSPIKFQADMGLLLAFMFVGNMIGALVLLPALAHFLLKPMIQNIRG